MSRRDEMMIHGWRALQLPNRRTHRQGHKIPYENHITKKIIIIVYHPKLGESREQIQPTIPTSGVEHAQGNMHYV